MDGYPGGNCTHSVTHDDWLRFVLESSHDDLRRNDWRAEQSRRYNTPDEQDSGYVPGRSRKTSGYEERPRVLSDSRSNDFRETAAARPRVIDDQDTSAGFDLPRTQEPRVNRGSYRSPNEGETNTSRSANRALSFGKNNSAEADPLPRTQEAEPHRSAYRSQTEDDATTSRPPNRALSFGKSNSADLDRQPVPLTGASTPRAVATSSSNYRTCMIEINISLGAGGRVSQLSATSNTANASATSTPLRTATTIDNVHVIDIDLRLPKNTAYIKTDGNERRWTVFKFHCKTHSDSVCVCVCPCIHDFTYRLENKQSREQLMKECLLINDRAWPMRWPCSSSVASSRWIERWRHVLKDPPI